MQPGLSLAPAYHMALCIHEYINMLHSITYTINYLGAHFNADFFFN